MPKRVWSCMNRRAHPQPESPELHRAIKVLKRLGYAVGQPTIGKDGHVLVTVGGKVLREEQVLERVREG